MSNVIPKEKMSAYQRWEMASFGDDRPSVQNAATAARQTTEQLAQLREEATRQGYAAGLEQGRADGFAQGIEAGRAAGAQDMMHMRQIAETFGAEVAHANEVIANDVLDLALDLSKAMLKTALAVRPELVLPIVSEAIRYLPTLQQPALLFLNPEDAALVRARMDEELTKAGWRMAEDAHLERGGCRVETASNQIDASASTRWQRIAGALGKESDWLK
jgi:flagellar assembly protein FliH